MVDLQLEFKVFLSEKDEPHPRFRLRLGDLEVVKSFEVPRTAHGRVTLRCTPGLVADRPVCIDLHADTVCTKPHCSKSIVARRFVASVVATWEEVCTGALLSSTDMLPGSVKFTVRCTNLRDRWDGDAKFQSAVRAFQTRARDAIDVLYEAALAANRTYRRGQWLDYSVHKFNASYNLAPVAPVRTAHNEPESSACIPMPGWCDLLHITRVQVSQRRRVERCMDHTLRAACARMRVPVAKFLASKPVTSSPLAKEVLCEAMTAFARGCVYVNDSVFDAERRKAVPCEHRGFPSLIDAPGAAGDDCESLSKESLLFVRLLESLFKPKSEVVAHAKAVAAQYVWMLTTGAARGGKPATLFCHVWVFGVPRELFTIWVERGRAGLRVLQKDGVSKATLTVGDIPRDTPALEVLCVESTEYTTATLSYRESDTREERMHNLYKDLNIMPKSARGVFRCKLPAGAVLRSNFYSHAVMGLTYQTYESDRCGEFQFVTLTGSAGVWDKSATWEDVMMHPERVALVPVHSVTSAERAAAETVLDWMPAIHARELHKHSADAVAAQERKDEDNAFLLQCRARDWGAKTQTALREWCKETGWKLVAEPRKERVCDLCEDVQIWLAPPDM